jgi:FAD/FMN-containing dehydrogenase
VIRYGLTRSAVLGLQVVTMAGDVLDLNGALEKNNTGPDLRQLFIGSEGTLGVITEATLKLVRVPKKLDVFLFAVPDLAGVLRLFRAARRGPFTITAYEFFTDRCLARLQKHRKLRSSHYVLLELEAAVASELDDWMTGLFEQELVTDGTMAQSSSQAAELWALREGISESLSATGLPHKNDISLPIAELEAFCAELEAVFTERYPDFEVCLFGHIGDGNLHINVMKPDALDKAAFLARTKAADHDMFKLVRAHQGSISAEHGVGLLKKDYLSYSRSPAELALIRALKIALDPLNLLNPGKIIDI